MIYGLMLVGIAVVSFLAGVLIGLLSRPRNQREAINDRVMEAVSDRTRTVIAVLKVSTGYWDQELALELEHPGDIIQEAIVLPDRRVAFMPVQKDRRGSYVRPPVLKLTPAEIARAF